VILGVSFDTVAENRAFAEKFNFPFRLLCDTEREIGIAYGACDTPKDGYARRISYVIDPAGAIAHVFPKVDAKGHPRAVLDLLE
jgi:peroxiredoxin Q/BCP